MCCSIEDYDMANHVFGDLNKYLLSTDVDKIDVGDNVTLINRNCEFEFDNVNGCFQNQLLYYFVVDLQLLDVDYSEYDVSKSNNGGKYAFAEACVTKIYEKTY